MNGLVTGILYGLGAIALALLVILPVLWIVNLLYDDGKGLTPLLLVSIAGAITLAVALRKRRISL